MGATASNAQSRTAQADKGGENIYGAGNATLGDGGLTWGALNQGILEDTVDAINDNGDGVSLAKGRRGAWLSITILTNGDRPRWEARSLAEMEVILVDLGNKARARRK